MENESEYKYVVELNDGARFSSYTFDKAFGVASGVNPPRPIIKVHRITGIVKQVWQPSKVPVLDIDCLVPTINVNSEGEEEDVVYDCEC